MADSIKEQIVSAYVTRLAQITTTNGYEYNSGVTVYRSIQDVDVVPCCVVWINPDTIQNLDFGSVYATFTLRIEALNEFGSTNYTIVQDKLTSDLIKCIFDPSVTISDKTEQVRFTTGGGGSNSNGSDVITGGFIELEIDYRFDIGDPYTQS